MKVGYVRVSTVEQNEARQIEAMKADGVERIYMDKKSSGFFIRRIFWLGFLRLQSSRVPENDCFSSKR